jgi:hypothetical protein
MGGRKGGDSSIRLPEQKISTSEAPLHFSAAKRLQSPDPHTSELSRNIMPLTSSLCCDLVSLSSGACTLLAAVRVHTILLIPFDNSPSTILEGTPFMCPERMLCGHGPSEGRFDHPMAPKGLQLVSASTVILSSRLEELSFEKWLIERKRGGGVGNWKLG